MRKNEKFVGTCESYTYEGLGVVKKDGFPVFVKEMMLDETGEIIITKVLKNYAFGRCLNRSVTSSQRVDALCPVYKQCGGCQLSHMSAAAQKAFKKQRVQDCMTRIAKLDVQVEDVLSMDEPYQYRNKGQLPIGVKDDRVVCGFYRIHSNEIIDMHSCLIQHDAINAAVQEIRTMIQEYGNGSTFRHLLIKYGFQSEEMMVVLIVKEEQFPYREEMVERISQFDHVKSIVLNLNQRNDNVILGEKEVLLYGKPVIEDKLHDLSFMISSKSFFQVNPIQTLTLYDKAVEFAQLSGKETVLDLYCGIGTISLFMARKAKKVIGIEVVPEAIEDAKKNATLNHIENVEFVCSDAGTFASELVEKNMKLDVVCVDPPRKGCDEKTLVSILKMSPKRIVYVSCDPATLARDLQFLSQNGYEVIKVQPVDMFPQTVHVETVVQLVRKKSDTFIDFTVDMDELDLTSSEAKATYDEIKDYIFDKHRVKVSSLYIAQVKQKHGIIERDCYYNSEKDNQKQPQCPPEKVKLIEEALRHFKMIP